MKAQSFEKQGPLALALECYQRAAAEGVAEAQYWLSSTHSQGRGMTMDKDKALNICLRPAKAMRKRLTYAPVCWKSVAVLMKHSNNFRGQRNSVVRLHSTISASVMNWVQANRATAIDFYSQAAREGVPSGQFNFARMLLQDGKAADAQYWLERAVDQRHAEAAVRLAQMNMHDLPKARKFYCLAVQNGHEGAAHTLLQLPFMQPDRRSVTKPSSGFAKDVHLPSSPALLRHWMTFLDFPNICKLGGVCKLLFFERVAKITEIEWRRRFLTEFPPCTRVFGDDIRALTTCGHTGNALAFDF